MFSTETNPLYPVYTHRIYNKQVLVLKFTCCSFAVAVTKEHNIFCFQDALEHWTYLLILDVYVNKHTVSDRGFLGWIEYKDKVLSTWLSFKVKNSCCVQGFTDDETSSF